MTGIGQTLLAVPVYSSGVPGFLTPLCSPFPYNSVSEVLFYFNALYFTWTLGFDQTVSCVPCTIYSDKAHPEFIRFTHLNVRSLNKKTDLFYDIILDKELVVFCISETWHQQNDFLNLNLCTPPGFTYLDKPRAIGKGGGLAVVYSTEVSVTEIVVPSVLSFESIVFKVSGVSPVLILFIIGHRNLTLCSLMNSQSYLHL